MPLLAIESTCDETAAAVIDRRRQVLSSVVASQDELHARWRGVVPEVASRAHVERILPVIDEAVRRSGISRTSIAAVAATPSGFSSVTPAGPRTWPRVPWSRTAAGITS